MPSPVSFSPSGPTVEEIELMRKTLRREEAIMAVEHKPSHHPVAPMGREFILPNGQKKFLQTYGFRRKEEAALRIMCALIQAEGFPREAAININMESLSARSLNLAEVFLQMAHGFRMNEITEVEKKLNERDEHAMSEARRANFEIVHHDEDEDEDEDLEVDPHVDSDDEEQAAEAAPTEKKPDEDQA